MPTQNMTAASLGNVVIDVGALYVDYGETNERMIGATKGGVTFNVEQNVRMIEADNARGPLKGGRRVTSETARLTASIMEMTADNISMALFGMTSGQRTLSAPQDSEYMTNVALVAGINGSNTDGLVITLKNVLVDGNFELSMEDENEGSVEVQFTAHFDPATLDQSPYTIQRTTI